MITLVKGASIGRTESIEVWCIRCADRCDGRTSPSEPDGCPGGSRVARQEDRRERWPRCGLLPEGAVKNCRGSLEERLHQVVKKELGMAARPSPGPLQPEGGP
jgi:hypothetical protein